MRQSGRHQQGRNPGNQPARATKTQVNETACSRHGAPPPGWTLEVGVLIWVGSPNIGFHPVRLRPDRTGQVSRPGIPTHRRCCAKSFFREGFPLPSRDRLRVRAIRTASLSCCPTDTAWSTSWMAPTQSPLNLSGAELLRASWIQGSGARSGLAVDGLASKVAGFARPAIRPAPCMSRADGASLPNHGSLQLTSRQVGPPARASSRETSSSD